MPLLSARRPRSISDSIASMLRSSSDLSVEDTSKIEERAANAGYRSALAQKALAEVEREREADALRRDPEAQARYGANVAGITEPQGSQLSKALRGMVAENPVANDDEGNALPVSQYQVPSDVSPEQRRAFQTAIASTLANLLATGKTNADQMTQAGGNLQVQGVRDRIAATPDVPTQNQLKAAITPGYREPYSGGMSAAGRTVNQETGEIINDPTLAPAADQAMQSLAGQREAAAATQEARAREAEARAELARARGQGGGGRGAGGAGGGKLSRPFEVTGPNGETILVQQRQGTGELVDVNTGEPIDGDVRPKSAATGAGRPLTKDAAKGLFENQQNLRRAEQALALINGAEVRDKDGNVVSKGDKNATGFKGFAPDALLQRLDAGGNATRAAIADLGSLIIHDRSGAAVTAAEFPRLQPFIPSSRDDPATVRTKLNRFVQEYRNVTQEMADFYSQSGYKVPTETLRGSGATPPEAATPGQRGASGAWGGQERRAQPRGNAPSKRVVVDF
jgi:hypothetical protein